MDHLEKALDVDCAYIDQKSLSKYTKNDFIAAIMKESSKYKKSSLDKKRKEELLQLYCSLKNIKLVDPTKTMHFPGKA